MAIGQKVPVVLHRFVAKDYCIENDSTGAMLGNLHYINEVFENMEQKYSNISIFDVRKASFYIDNIRGNGIFIEDVAYFTPETNKWVAKEISEEYNLKV